MSQMSFETFGPVVSSYLHHSLCGISMLLVIANKGTYHSTETTGRHEESNTRNLSKSGLKYTEHVLHVHEFLPNSIGGFRGGAEGPAPPPPPPFFSKRFCSTPTLLTILKIVS